jgi:hypothetical protein
MQMKKLWIWLTSPAIAGAVGILGLIFGIYSGFFYERRPEVVVSVDSMSKVFDLYRPVGGLEVAYGGEDLRTAKKNLWVLTATIKNFGNAEVRKGDYDEKVPLGIEIHGAVIAEHPTVKTGVAYLSENLEATSSANKILFSPVIIEAGESFDVTALLLGSDTAKPTISPVGKLAGIKSIILSTPERPSPEKSLWGQSIAATSFWVHVIRVPIYFFGAMFALLLTTGALAAVLAPFEKMRARKQINERQERAREYRRHEELRKESRFLIDQYVGQGTGGLAPIAHYLAVQARREAILSVLDGKLDEQTLDKLIRSAVPYRYNEDEVEEQLKSAHLVEGDGIRINVPRSINEALDDLCGFLGLDAKELALPKYARGMKLEGLGGISVEYSHTDVLERSASTSKMRPTRLRR